jgi:hypothetical protein
MPNTHKQTPALQERETSDGASGAAAEHPKRSDDAIAGSEAGSTIAA